MPAPQPKSQTCHDEVKYVNRNTTNKYLIDSSGLVLNIKTNPIKINKNIGLYGNSPFLGEKITSMTFGESRFEKPSLL